MCHEKGESVAHLISECSKLAQKEYKKRHDNVARMIRWELCGVHGLDRADKCYEHQPQSVSETDKTKVLWDFNIQCDNVIEARRPDIVVVGKEDRVCKIFDVAVPADGRVNAMDSENHGDMTRLRR